MNSFKFLYLFFLISFCSLTTKASHIFGGELGYTHLGNNTYEIYLILYGDCSGTSFPSFQTSVPNIQIYNGTSAFSNINLLPFGNFGLEITPVCPSQAANTTCNGGFIPGIAQFKFKNQITLNTPSADWQFIFDGDMGGSTLAGRSAAIGNLSNTNSVMKLIATLNNLNGPNSSANYTSIPTPFFCINTAQQYNQGAVDPDGDVLSFSLTPGLVAQGGGNLTYANGYTYDAPLATGVGNFSFNPNNGQMNFTPNLVQNSLVVNKVTETRNGVVVGTSMREMTFVVLSNCTNQPAVTPPLTNNNVGSVDSMGQLRVCHASGNISFQCNSSDPDGNNLFLAVSGLPSGATASINGNNTTAPLINFSWNFAQLPPFGNYTFYVTYQDDGCPLSTKVTVAYTIIIEEPITASISSESESCMPGSDGKLLVNATSTNGLISYSLDSLNYVSSNVFSNLVAGNYTVYLQDPAGCKSSISSIVGLPAKPVISNLLVQEISCLGDSDGSIVANVTPLNASNNFLLLPNNISNNNGSFSGLNSGNYTVVVVDDKNCVDSASTMIITPPLFQFSTVQIDKLSCGEINGRIILSTNFTDLINYELQPGAVVNTTGVFDNLNVGTYTINATSSKGCSTNTTAIVGLNANDFKVGVYQKSLPCIGRGDEGSAFVAIQGGLAPYKIVWNTIPNSFDDTIKNLKAGVYQVTVTDDQGCVLEASAQVETGTCCEQIFFPDAFSPNSDGVNDEFKMTTSTGLAIKQYEIFNRWGNSVWKSMDQFSSWDGKINNVPAAMDTYFYILRYECQSDRNLYLKKGNVILVR